MTVVVMVVSPDRYVPNKGKIDCGALWKLAVLELELEGLGGLKDNQIITSWFLPITKHLIKLHFLDHLTFSTPRCPSLQPR